MIMRIFKFLFSLSITVILVAVLDMKLGSIPPLGKFLDPVNGFWANAESDLAMPKELSLPGLKGNTQVLYDEMLVPHIFSEVAYLTY